MKTSKQTLNEEQSLKLKKLNDYINQNKNIHGIKSLDVLENELKMFKEIFYTK